MHIQVEKALEIYRGTILFPIWRESLPALDERRINWSYEENVCGKAKLWLLKDESTGEYFGCSALLPRYLFINGKRRLCGIIVDMAVKKKYRALGPALKVLKEIMRDSECFALILAFPNKIAEVVFKVAGFRSSMNLVNNIKILRSKTVIENRVKNRFFATLLLPFTTIVDFGLRLLDSRISVDKKYGTAHVDRFDERFDVILEKAKKQFNFFNDRSSKYLNWRYKDCPYKEYNIFVVKELNSRNLVGYIVYYLNDETAFVDDFLWLEQSLRLEVLLYIFIEAMRKKEIKAISFTLVENKTFQKAFNRMGFARKKCAETILYFSSDELLNDIMPALKQEAFITLGDQDI